MNNFVQRVWGGGGDRVSRFHAEDNRFMGVAQFRHLPTSVGIKVANRLLGTHPRLPAWPYPAMRSIEAVLQPDWRVLEFGSGWSTLWLADRAAEVVSIESSPVWAAFVQKKAESCGAVVKVLQRELEDYPDTASFADASFDLCVIDGWRRQACLENALRLIRPGGYLYLDTSEAARDEMVYAGGGSRQAVRQSARVAARDSGGELKECRGLIVGEVFAGDGILLRKGGN
ncbi:MAG: O-methyltransferase [Sphingomonadales bacterium]